MKKVIIAMPLDEKLQDRLIAQIKELPFLSDSSVEFLHIFLEQNYPYMIPSTFYPDQEQKVEIKKTVEEVMQKITTDVPAADKKYTCLFSESPKESMVDYIKENNVELIIADSRMKRGISGLFTSSFTEYLVKHAPSRVLVLR